MSFETNNRFFTDCMGTIIAMFIYVLIIVDKSVDVWVIRIVCGYHDRCLNFWIFLNCQ